MSFNRRIFVIFIAFVASWQLLAQKIVSVEYESQAEVKIYVVEYESQCDLKVHKVEYESQAKGNEGLWYFTNFASQADLKIYFVPYKSKAGWKNKKYMPLLY
ncbi:DUF6150 family protein [Flavobacteriaceae bacterium]|jgi:hypothetical protein|nr:DUF6150 family protein [Flavobacteriaceae bacterium]